MCHSQPVAQLVMDVSVWVVISNVVSKKEEKSPLVVSEYSKKNFFKSDKVLVCSWPYTWKEGKLGFLQWILLVLSVFHYANSEIYYQWTWFWSGEYGTFNVSNFLHKTTSRIATSTSPTSCMRSLLCCDLFCGLQSDIHAFFQRQRHFAQIVHGCINIQSTKMLILSWLRKNCLHGCR